jgi:archaellum component FlaG (FlaF/FlaG flagellin family)
MAGADLIGTAICIGLLVIVAYVVAGSIMTTAGVVTTAQMDMNRLQEERLNTDILVVYCVKWVPALQGSDVEFYIKNTGSTIIDPTELNMVIITDGSPSVIFIKSTGDGDNTGSSPDGTWVWKNEIGQAVILENPTEYWTVEKYNIGKWDPGEIMAGWMKMTPHPVEFHVFTPNGATGYLPVDPTPSVGWHGP